MRPDVAGAFRGHVPAMWPVGRSVSGMKCLQFRDTAPEKPVAPAFVYTDAETQCTDLPELPSGSYEAGAMTPAQKEVLQELQSFAQTAASPEAVMERVAKRLHERFTRYNWVGFYLVDPADSGFLIVGPYAGSFTPNVRIPLNTGLCGAAATSGQIVVVQDVTADPRYLPGSSMVKSEIVVPIFVKKKLAGELDVESYFADSFPKSEQEFAEACAKVFGDYLAKA